MATCRKIVHYFNWWDIAFILCSIVLLFITYKSNHLIGNVKLFHIIFLFLIIIFCFVIIYKWYKKNNPTVLAIKNNKMFQYKKKEGEIELFPAYKDYAFKDLPKNYSDDVIYENNIILKKLTFKNLYYPNKLFGKTSVIDNPYYKLETKGNFYYFAGEYEIVDNYRYDKSKRIYASKIDIEKINSIQFN